MKSKKYLNFFVSLHGYQRYAATLTTLGMFLFFWFHFIFSNFQDQINTNREKIANIAKNKNLIEESKKSSIFLEKQITELKKNLEKYTPNKESKNKNHINISIPINHAKKSGLNLIACSTSDKEQCQELFNKQNISYEFSGNKTQVFSFCNKLKNDNNIIYCEKIIISENNENNCTIKCILQFFHTKSL